jgi:BASS family bile acid:Na+ symporter
MKLQNNQVINFIENNVPLFLIISIPLGLLFPYFAFLRNYITYLLMIVLFITFLKMDILEIVHHIKRPMLLLYIEGMSLIAAPIIVYFILTLLKFDYIVVAALVLLAAAPAGVASSAMTALTSGETSLNVIIIFVSHFIAPFTIPFLFFILFRKYIRLDYFNVLITMAKLILIPLVASFLSKQFFKEKINLVKERSSLLTIIPIFLISLTIISINAPFIKSNPLQVAKYLLIVYPEYFFFMIFGFVIVFWLNLKEKIAVSNSKTFTNVSIVMVLAFEFFDPKVALIIAIAQLPWSTMLVPVNIMLKLIRKKVPENQYS